MAKKIIPIHFRRIHESEFFIVEPHQFKRFSREDQHKLIKKALGKRTDNYFKLTDFGYPFVHTKSGTYYAEGDGSDDITGRRIASTM